MGQFNWTGIVIAAIGVIASWLAGRAAKTAQKYSARTEAETEAYERARKMDVGTIERQDQEIKELRQEVKDLKIENEALRKRVSLLEQGNVHG